MSDEDKNRVIDAHPTKTFFIHMITMDIDMIDAILDLVDNCVDGARRLHYDEKYDGLSIRIEVDTEKFKITDNCGGMTAETARKYAFRFGRADDAPSTKHSMGRFGVGMKRALFKIGRNFQIESKSSSSSFTVSVDVALWERVPEWEFQFERLEEGLHNDPGDLGTTLLVTTLRPDVAELFGQANFITELKLAIQSKHRDSMNRGMSITLNGFPLRYDTTELLQSEELKPAFSAFDYRGPNDSPVNVKIYAGIGKSNPTEAGWYVFCNGRMVLEANQDDITGWGELGQNRIPKYHNQFSRFRGFVFFDSDDPGALPWNTTKNGVNRDSKEFKGVKLRMITMARPIINFLNQLDKENDFQDSEDRPLVRTVDMATAVQIAQVVEQRQLFQTPVVRSVPDQPASRRIAYEKPESRVNKVKAKLRAGSYKEVGELTFDYFYENECD